tara:strand:+ start:303 stop:536 length:234 start_codon:yes stop_codon:yes gene_type:complete
MSDINTIPIQQFISAVKGADAKRAKEIKLDIDTAKRLAFTLGEAMAKLNSDLEMLLKKQQEQEEVVQVTMDGGGNWK